MDRREFLKYSGAAFLTAFIPGCEGKKNLQAPATNLIAPENGLSFPNAKIDIVNNFPLPVSFNPGEFGIVVADCITEYPEWKKKATSYVTYELLNTAGDGNDGSNQSDVFPSDKPGAPHIIQIDVLHDLKQMQNPNNRQYVNNMSVFLQYYLVNGTFKLLRTLGATDITEREFNANYFGEFMPSYIQSIKYYVCYECKFA